MLKRIPKSGTMLTGFVVYEPDNYDKTKQYPLVLLFHGQGEMGDGTATGLQGLYDFINSQWNGFMWRLVKNDYILIAPQLLGTDGNWKQQYADEGLKFAKTSYSLDVNRETLMTISLGGQIGWTLPATLTQEFAAVVNICAVWVQSNFCNIKTPVWAFHALYDPRVPSSGTKSAVDAINVCNPPVKAKATFLNKNIHEIWGDVLANALLPGETEIVWDWITKQTKGSVITPTPTPAPTPVPTTGLKADGSATQSTVILGGPAILDASKSVGYKQTSGGYESIIWNNKYRPKDSDWNIFPNYNKTGKIIALQNLVLGEYGFEVTVEDWKGNKNTDDTVKITVTPAPTAKKIIGEATINGKIINVFEDNTWAYK